MTTVTVLVPAYNEEATIVEILRRVNAQVIEGVAFEIVVIDDGLAPSPLVLRHGGEAEEAIEVPATPALDCAIMAFADAIRDRSRDEASLRLGLDTVTVLARCQRHLDG